MSNNCWSHTIDAAAAGARHGPRRGRSERRRRRGAKPATVAARGALTPPIERDAARNCWRPKSRSRRDLPGGALLEEDRARAGASIQAALTTRPSPQVRRLKRWWCAQRSLDTGVVGRSLASIADRRASTPAAPFVAEEDGAARWGMAGTALTPAASARRRRLCRLGSGFFHDGAAAGAGAGLKLWLRRGAAARRGLLGRGLAVAAHDCPPAARAAALPAIIALG